MSRKRLLGLLAALALIEATVAFLPTVTRGGWSGGSDVKVDPIVGWGFSAAFGTALLLQAFLVVLALRSSYPHVARTSITALLLAETAFMVQSYLPMLNGTHVAFPFLELVGYTLTSVAAPVLWGSAMARRDTPLDDRAARLGRVFAGLAQLGFMLLFCSQIYTYWRNNVADFFSGSWASVLLSACEVVWRIAVFWCSVEAMRTDLTSDRVRKRARRMVRLLWTWFVLSAFAYVLGSFSWMLEKDATGFTKDYFWFALWRGAADLTATGIVAILVASRPPGYKSAGTDHSQDGAAPSTSGGTS